MKHFLLVIIFLLGTASLAQAAEETTSPMTASTQSSPCAGALPTRLGIGVTGRVTPGLPNSIRTQPNTTTGSAVIGQIPGGSSFLVLFGPSCSGNMVWWQVNYNGIIGWTPEGQNGVYWLEPISCPNAPAPRLTVGGQGRVTPGLPNNIRTQPGGTQIGQIPAGGIFSVVSGPVCSGNLAWWQVNYNGVVGWTPEGQTGTYWLEPYTSTSTCAITLPTRLSAGRSGRVTLGGLPNNIRSQPGLTSSRVGQIPPGGVFSVIQGPQCNGGMAWWQVSYNGIVGWTSEGRSNTYWLEPY